MKFRHLLGTATLITLVSAGFAGQVGFEEDFALAPDRTVPLQQLIVGTPDYYYYHCLHYQNTGDLAKAQEMLDAWIQRHGREGRVIQMENRQALLEYDTHAQKSLDYLALHLGLNFNHERDTVDRQRLLPSALDPSLISRERLTALALTNTPDTLGGLENSALEFIDTASLSEARLHEFLTRLERPDLPGLPNLITRDLQTRYSVGFTLPIHRQLLLAQLDELLRLRPDLLNDTNFVNTYLVRLRPADGVDWRHDAKQEQAYLDRLWNFVAKLGPVHNSLKAHVLYQRLVFDRTQGVWDKDRFAAYLQIPRNVGYMNPAYMDAQQRRSYPADLNGDFSAITQYRPIVTDEPLARSYFLHFFVEARDYNEYRPYVVEDYLKEAFAEAKIVNNVGDQESWYAMLPPEKYQALKDRIDLDFAFTNKQYYRPQDSVGLDLNVKNVKTLLVKVFDINTPSYYRTNGRELGTDIPLDGLVANEEKVVTYDDPPLRRSTRHFDFPNLNHRGAYIIEFIGNGISSRALIIKGKLHFLEEAGSAGHVFTVLDEDRKQLAKDVSLWLAGHEYKADVKDGTITVPYSTAPGPQPIVLQYGDFASFDQFTHEQETYSFKAAFHVDRESLIRGAKASVIIRPMLYVNGEAASLRLLEEPTLEIISVDRQGTPTSKEVGDFPLLIDRETTYEFQVPDNLASISFVLRGKVKNLSQNKKIDLADSRQFAINGIDASDKIADLFFAHISGQYVVDVLGKSGEPLADQAVQFVLKHHDFTAPVNVTLKSDAKGRIALGALEGIASITASAEGGVQHVWTPVKDMHSPIASANGLAGQPIVVPYMGSKPSPSTAELSLLEMRGGNYYADRFSALRIKDGLMSMEDLPEGDYSLRFKDSGQMVSVRVAPGEVRDGWVLSDTRFLQQRDPAPLQVASVVADADNVTIKLVNATKLTQVHVVASRYVPEFSLFDSLGLVPQEDNAAVGLTKLDAQYIAGRNIGDEYRYILERKYTRIFPGNMLARPGLILNPWSIRKTDTSKQTAAAGEPVSGSAGRGLSQLESLHQMLASVASAGGFSTLDFLPYTSVVLTDLVPDDKGIITISRKDLGEHQEIQVLAVDLGVSAYREISLAETPLVPRDLRLKEPLDVTKHFTEQKQITIVERGATLTSGAASTVEVYDSLPKVYRLFATLSKDPTLAEFSFIADWPKMTAAQKQEKYSKYACHELNFFLSRKDPEFFRTVIQPYLRNKKDKTFMDHYLMGDDLGEYVKPWNYEHLNVAEQALLAERIATEQAATARHIKDRFDLLPVDIEQFNQLFRTALQGEVLEGQNKFGMATTAPAAMPAPAILGGLGSIDGPRGAVEGGGGFGGGGRGGASGGARRGVAESSAAAKSLEADEVANLADSAGSLDRSRVVALRMLNDQAARDKVAQLYLKLDRTEEWAENNYYHLPIEKQDGSLIAVNAFWKDYAAAPNKAGFLSTNLAEAAHSFSEIMLALGVLDLPFESPKHETTSKDNGITLTAGGRLVAFHREIHAAEMDPVKTPILVSQNFFRASDRYTFVDNERSDKYVADEFLTHVVYGCQVVVTNPTSSRQKLDVLLQIPAGALPVSNGLYTRGLHEDLNPFESRAIEYYFYFPMAGTFGHFPVHVARNEKVIAFTAADSMKVVDTPTTIDTTSWDYISQNGTAPQVLQYLQNANIDRLNLDRIAWRMRDSEIFSSVINLLAARHVYSPTLWAYAIKNNSVPAIREFLQHVDNFDCGPAIDCTLLTLDPVIRRSYQLLEYSPLVNARAHRMGRTRQIVNDRFFEQYERLMTGLRYRPALSNDDYMSMTYYMLLQDRIEEAQGFFARVDAGKLSTRLQYDYFRAYLDFYTDSHALARSIADQYKQYPVDRWRELFATVGAQLDELEGKGGSIVSKDDRNQQQAALAANASNLEFKVDARKITLNYQNVTECRVNYYLMDIELMFSQNPFLGQFAGQFSSIRPNESVVMPLDRTKSAVTFDLPEKFRNSNVMIEVVADGITRSQAYYANSLVVQTVENYGQLRVTGEKDGQALAKVYVKIYARFKDGRIEFYKDGYTDLRGRFDYTALSTNDLDNVDRFSILLLSETQGAVVREAAPPKQ